MSVIDGLVGRVREPAVCRSTRPRLLRAKVTRVLKSFGFVNLIFFCLKQAHLLFGTFTLRRQFFFLYAVNPETSSTLQSVSRRDERTPVVRRHYGCLTCLDRTRRSLPFVVKRHHRCLVFTALGRVLSSLGIFCMLKRCVAHYRDHARGLVVPSSLHYISFLFN